MRKSSSEDLQSQSEECVHLLVGCYGKRIYKVLFDTCSRELTIVGEAEAVNASYVVADGDNIYTFSESGPESKVYSFNSLESGDIVCTSVLDCPGADPCFAIASPNGRCYFTADYSGGSISAYQISEGKIERMGGKIQFSGSGPHIRRQTAPHIHQLKWLPESCGCGDSWILASDLGADRIRVVKVGGLDGENIELSYMDDIVTPPGSGPRHMEFSADGRVLYCLTELSGEVFVYMVSVLEGVPSFELKQRIVADEVSAGGSADIHLDPSGKYLYTSHRLRNDGISVFKVLDNGLLERVGYTHTALHPRSFYITDDGKSLLVASKDERCIEVYGINDDGSLLKYPGKLSFEQEEPVCIIRQ